MKTSDTNSTDSFNALKTSSFPWPIRDGSVIPAVFIQCASEEDLGDRSKSNEGQVDVVRHVLKLLSAPKNPSEEDSKESEANLKVHRRRNKYKHYAGACLHPSMHHVVHDS